MNTKDRILDVTLDILRKEGFEKITVRRIAEQAEVNVASVSYYFGSKENLISNALEVILKDARKAFEFLYDESLGPRERLKRFLVHYAAVGLANPEALRRLLFKGTFDFDSQKDYLQFLRNFGIEKVKQTIGEMSGIKDEDTLLLITFQMFSAMLFPCIMHPVIREMLGYDLKMEDKIDTYFELMLDRYADNQ